MNATKLLTHLIRAGRDALHLDATLTDIGYRDTPYFSLSGEIADAITYLLDEHPETYEDSTAYAAIHDVYTTDEQCAEQLAERMPAFPSVPDATLSLIRECARERCMDANDLISLILSDWARKEVLFRAAFAE
jgi:hypothetical protein